MKLRKVISGGQTGADQAGLACAKALGLETGGTAPKGYKTENGHDLSLKDFGLVEDANTSYPPRTRKNVRNSDCTVWFGKTGSPGYYCTYRAALDLHKPFYINPTPEEFRELADRYEIANIAGNRRSKNPDVVAQVVAAFSGLSKE